MDDYISVLKKFAVFSGRAARRREFWTFFIINGFIAFMLGFVEGLINLYPGSSLSVLGTLYLLAVIVPSIAVAARRMHDVGKNGWYQFIPIYNLVLLVQDGTPDRNRYGNDPKGRSSRPAIEDPDATWNCPQCGYTNPNTTFACRACRYRLR